MMNKYSTDCVNIADHDQEASATTTEHEQHRVNFLNLPLAIQIRLAREERNLSQEDLANKIGVSEQAVKNWEKEVDGRSSTPRKVHWNCLEDVLGTTLYMSQHSSGNAAMNPAIAEIYSIAQMIAAMPRATRQAFITLIKASTPGNDLLTERNEPLPVARKI